MSSPLAPILAPLPVLARPRTGEAAVRIAPEAHPDRAAHVELGDFDGPLALLLALIEQRQVDILEVSLGDLAVGFLDAIAALEDAALSHLSAFITVASQLILIKSRAILPRPPVTAAVAADGADPEEELRRRLIDYKRYRDAGALLGARLAAGRSLHHREPAAASASAVQGAVAPPPAPLDIRLLVRALDRAFRIVPPPPPPPEIVRRVITIEDRVAVIRGALARASAFVLQDLLRDSRDRIVIAITFLALLEMAKAREVRIEQDEPWGPIRCSRPEARA